MSDFQLDYRLSDDTVYIGRHTLCEIRLMNDKRWPWLILVPTLAGAEEIHNLPVMEQAQIARETSIIAEIFKDFTNCEKINTAAIGNIVRQLHIHVIARNKGDANWPGPVWGYEKAEPYENSSLINTVNQMQKALSINKDFSI